MLKSLLSSKISPWSAGVLITLLFAVSLFVLNDSVGMISAYSKLFEQTINFLNGSSTKLSWEEFFLIGLFIGSIIAALSSKKFKFQLFPEDHLSKGPAFFLTIGLLINFVGGFLVMIGMIIAGNTFIKMWIDAIGLFIVVFVFLVIVFIEAVILGTFLSLRISIDEK